MFIELLESRIAPAALINLTTSGQGLKVKADSNGDPVILSLSIDPAGGVDVSSPFSLVLNGSPVNPGPNGLHLPSVLGGITIDGGSQGNNAVQLAPEGVFGGGITMNLPGTGNNVSIAASVIAGSVSITAPAGGTEVLFNGPQSTLIGGSLKLALGNAAVSQGQSGVDITVPEFSVAGSISYLGSPSKLPAGQNTATGSNNFEVNNTELFSVAGNVTFNSRLLPGSISLESQMFHVTGSVAVAETTSVTSVADEFAGETVNIGGAFTWSSTGGQGLTLTGGSFSVGGRVTLNAGTGDGEIQIEASTTNLGSITAVGTGLFSDEAQGGPIDINGSVSLSNFAVVEIQGLGSIGGSLRATNVAQVHLSDGFTANGESLVIGGSVAITGPNTARGDAPTSVQGMYTAGNLIVGGSYSVTTNSAPVTLVTLANSSIFGSVNYHLQAATVALEQDGSADQMLISGAFNVTFTSGSSTVNAQSFTPTVPIVLGPAKIIAPDQAADTFTYVSTLFALPVQIVA